MNGRALASVPLTTGGKSHDPSPVHPYTHSRIASAGGDATGQRRGPGAPAAERGRSGTLVARTTSPGRSRGGLRVQPRASAGADASRRSAWPLPGVPRRRTAYRTNIRTNAG